MELSEDISVYHEVVRLPLFPVAYDVFVGYDSTEVEKHINDIFPGFDPEIAGRRLGGRTIELNHYQHGKALIVAIILQKDKDITRRSIVHETVHLTWAVMQQVGVNCNYQNDEVQAYLAEEIWETVNKIVFYGYDNIKPPLDDGPANEDSTSSKIH